MFFHWSLAAFAGWHAAKENWVLVLIAIVVVIALQFWQWRKISEHLARDVTKE